MKRMKILGVLLILGAVFLTGCDLNKESTKVANNKPIEKGIKKDSSKELVYDAEYKSDSVKEYYTVETTVNGEVTYYLSDIKVPYINIDSEASDMINKEIKNIYLDLEKKFTDTVKDATGNQFVEATYDYVIANNVLSVVIKTVVAGTGFSPYDYYTYNIDLDTLKTLDYNDLLDKLTTKYNLTKDSDFIGSALDNYYSQNISFSGTEKEKSLEDAKKQLKSEIENGSAKCYYDKNENINCVFKYTIPVEIGYDYGILNISKSQIK